MWKWCLQALREVWSVGKVVPLVAIPVGLGMMHVWNQYRVTRLGYEISKATSRHEKLVDQRRKLTVEFGVEARSDQVERLGRRRFGLETISPQQVIDVSPGGGRVEVGDERASLEWGPTESSSDDGNRSVGHERR